MTTTQAGVVLQHIHRLAAANASGHLGDRQLLERFMAQREQAAFEVLLRRHGPMVYGVCRRVLGNAHDAEDAFQATFLVLARRADTIGRSEAVGGWLYQVAYNTALKTKASEAARRRRELRPEARLAPDPLTEVTGRELLTVLDDELQNLPERHRAPLVLCYLEGLTRDEAASRLGFSESTLKRRLDEGRERLRLRLERRGLALSAALLAVGVGATVVPSALAAATARAALIAARGKTGIVSASVASVTAALLHINGGVQRKVIAAIVLTTILLATGAGVRAYRAPKPDDLAPFAAAEPPQPAAEERPAEPAAADKKEMSITGRILGSDGKPVPGAVVVVLGMPLRPFRSGDSAAYKEVLLAEGKADAEGRFQLTSPRTSSAKFRDVFVVATAEKQAPAWRRLSPDGERPEADLTLPPEQIVRGSLVDLQGQPAAGVKVSVSSIGKTVNGMPDGVSLAALPKRAAPWPETVTTDDKGRFEIRGCNRDREFSLTVLDDRVGKQSFHVEKPGKPRPGNRVLGLDAGGNLIEHRSEPDEKGQAEEPNFSLAPAHILTGQVVYADTGKPAAKAMVYGTQADDDGKFLLRFAGIEAVTLEIQAAEGEPYLSIHQRVQWPKGTVKQEVKITLPRGVLVRGKVTEAGTGLPVAGAGIQFWPSKTEEADRPRNILTDWSHSEVTKQDGTFRMAVPPGAGHLLFQGPTPDFIHTEIGREVLSTGRPGGGRVYPDAFVKLDISAKEEPKEVAITLRRGATVRGRLVGPDGKPVARAVMLHRLHIGFDLSWHFPSEALDGVFEVHGLDPERSVPVYFLDAENQCGATVELSGKQAGETVTVKLMPCGKATARYLDAKGQPFANSTQAPEIVITPGAAKTNRASEAKEELLADAESLVNLDRHNYWDRIKTDAKGRVTFPALIPGATYRVNRFEDDYWVLHKEFKAESGKTIDLGDITIKVKDK